MMEDETERELEGIASCSRETGAMVMMGTEPNSEAVDLEGYFPVLQYAISPCLKIPFLPPFQADVKQREHAFQQYQLNQRAKRECGGLHLHTYKNTHYHFVLYCKKK